MLTCKCYTEQRSGSKGYGGKVDTTGKDEEGHKKNWQIGAAQADGTPSLSQSHSIVLWLLQPLVVVVLIDRWTSSGAVFGTCCFCFLLLLALVLSFVASFYHFFSSSSSFFMFMFMLLLLALVLFIVDCYFICCWWCWLCDVAQVVRTAALSGRRSWEKDMCTSSSLLPELHIFSEFRVRCSGDRHRAVV